MGPIKTTEVQGVARPNEGNILNWQEDRGTYNPRPHILISHCKNAILVCQIFTTPSSPEVVVILRFYYS